MKSTKKKRLETKGWKAGTAAEFLQLSPEESAYIDGVRRRRRNILSLFGKIEMEPSYDYRKERNTR